MAASTTVFSTTPLVGLALGATGTSTPAVAALTKCAGSDGRAYIYGKASEALTSTATCKIGAAGSVSDDSGSAGWIANVPGGLTAGQYGWFKRSSLA